MTNISLKVAPTDRTINIQCHAVNQEVADTKVESHSVSVLCEYHIIPSSVIRRQDQLYQLPAAKPQLLCQLLVTAPRCQLQCQRRCDE